VKGGKMEEIKIEPISNSKSMTERLEAIEQKIDSGKSKKLRIRKAKVGKAKMRKGYVGILRIDENGNITGEKVKMEDFSYKLKNGTYHASDGKEVLMWEGKFPVIVQPTWKNNPINLKKEKEENNETYGQKYVMAKMLKDAIIVKKKGNMSIIIWILVIGAILFGVKYFFGK